MKEAVVVIDMINDFADEKGVLYVQESKDIINPIKRLLEEKRAQQVPIIYTNDAHLRNDSEFNLFPPHAIIGTEGAEIIPELSPKEGDYVIKKRRYSAFFSTDLHLLLRELKVDKLILVGLVTEICVLHTAADAFFLGYNIEVKRSCVASLKKEDKEHALTVMQKLYGAVISDG